MRKFLAVVCMGLLSSFAFCQDETPTPTPTPETEGPETLFNVLEVNAKPCGFIAKVDSLTTFPLALQATYMVGDTTTTVLGPWINTINYEKASTIFVGNLPIAPTTCTLRVLMDEGLVEPTIKKELGEKVSHDVLWAILGTVPENQKLIVLQSMYASMPEEQIILMRNQTYVVQLSLKLMDYAQRIADIQEEAANKISNVAVDVMTDGMIVNELNLPE